MPASSASLLAATTVAGNCRATSSAWLGPLSTASGRGPVSSARISVGLRNVSISIPFVRLTIGTFAGNKGAMRVSVDRRWMVGIASMSRSAFAVASARSAVRRITGGMRMPGR